MRCCSNLDVQDHAEACNKTTERSKASLPSSKYLSKIPLRRGQLINLLMCAIEVFMMSISVKIMPSFILLWFASASVWRGEAA